MPKPWPIQVKRPLMAATSDRIVNTFVLDIQSQLNDFDALHMKAGRNSQNLACNNHTENTTETEGMESVSWAVLPVLVTTVHNDLPTCDGLLSLRDAHLTDRDGRRDRHDRGRNKILSGDTKRDVCREHGAGNGGETLRLNVMSSCTNFGEGEKGGCVTHRRSWKDGAPTLS